MQPIQIHSGDLERDPHHVYRVHRPRTPFLRREDGVYLAIRAAEVTSLATDSRTRQMEMELALSRGVREGALFDFFKHTMLLSNGATHRSRRAPLSRAFALKLIDNLRPHVRALANELIDQHYIRGQMNFRDKFATWLPARVLCDMLGIPRDDIPEFTANVYQLARALGSSFTQEAVPELEAAAYHLTQYVDGLLHDRRVTPRTDFLTAYTRATADANALSPVEILMQIVTIILAGSDTTRAALVIQMSLLLQHREQWEALCHDPSLIPNAVLETLRYEPSVASFARLTLEDIEIDDCQLPRGSILSLSTLAAMRDPALYSEPDEFDISRTDHPRRPMVFGAGAHRCLGEILALVELEESLAAFAQRLPQLRLAGEPPVIEGHAGIRQVAEMRLTW